MPFTKPSAEELDRVADEVVAHLRSVDRNPLARPADATFADIERAAHEVGQRVAARLAAEALAGIADEQSAFAHCPKCRNATRVTRKRRKVLTHDGPVDYLEPAAHCLACRRDFFPPASE